VVIEGFGSHSGVIGTREKRHKKYGRNPFLGDNDKPEC
jgi:hypothetical protein